MIAIKLFIYNLINTIVLVCICITLSAQDVKEIAIANEYNSNGEKEKAITAYKVLAKNSLNIPLIHANYLALMISLNKYNQAEDYLDRLIKKENRFFYQLDLGVLYFKSGELQKANKYFSNLFKTHAADAYKMKSAAEHLSTFDLLEYSTQALLEAREATHNPSLFALELANFFRLLGKKQEMVNEYLNYVTQAQGNISYVKNVLQVFFTKPEEFKILEDVLYQRLQESQQSEILSDLLIWVNLQQKKFYGAFIQARAYDKRFKKEQSKTLEIGQIALNNLDYESAVKSFTFVAKEYSNIENRLPAQLGIIKAREAMVKKKFPVNKDSVNYLIGEYNTFQKQYANQPSADEAQIGEALLYAYYLDQKDSASNLLTRLITKQHASAQVIAQAKINLGDIYLLKGEPWESTLLYSQVEKSLHESQLGYEAKLRNAKLWYFNGDFKLAEEHLDILKQATSREIANDAMELSMRIKENIAADSSGAALKEFAAIELLIYQNKIDDALEKLQHFQSAKTSPSIVGGVYWLEANLKMKRGKFNESIEILDKIITEFGDDILADDAYFLKGDIYEHPLNDKKKAMEIYRDFLNKFPGSVFAAEARKRFRMLRGDFEEKVNQ